MHTYTHTHDELSKMVENCWKKLSKIIIILEDTEAQKKNLYFINIWKLCILKLNWNRFHRPGTWFVDCWLVPSSCHETVFHFKLEYSLISLMIKKNFHSHFSLALILTCFVCCLILHSWYNWAIAKGGKIVIANDLKWFTYNRQTTKKKDFFLFFHVIFAQTTFFFHFIIFFVNRNVHKFFCRMHLLIHLCCAYQQNVSLMIKLNRNVINAKHERTKEN